MAPSRRRFIHIALMKGETFWRLMFKLMTRVAMWFLASAELLLRGNF